MPSRRKLIEMNEEELRAYVESAHTLIIISNGRHGYPHPMPMWFARNDDGSLVCTTFGKSQKVLNWMRDSRATLLVESGEEYSELRGVVIYAKTEIIEDHDQVVDILVSINSKGRSLDVEQLAKLREAVRSTATKRVALRFTPNKYVSWDHTKLGGRY